MCRKVLAIILIIVFIPVFLVTILVINTKSSLLNPDYYKTNLAKEKVYSQIVSDVLPALAQELGKENTDNQIAMMLALSGELIQASWLEEQVNYSLDAFYNYLIGKTDQIEAKISLSELKVKLSTSLTQDIAENIKDLPECSTEDMQGLDQDSGIPSCIPPGMSEQDIEKILGQINSSQLNQETGFFAEMPDELNFNELLDPQKNSLAKSQLEIARQVFTNLNTIAYILISMSILLLILIGLLIWKPASSIIKWLSTSLLIPSILLLAIALFGYVASLAFVKGFLPTISSVILVVVDSFARALIQPFFRQLIIISSSVIILAIIGYIIANLLTKKATPPKNR